MSNLSMVKKGAYYVVDGLDSGAPFKIRRRLYELGFISGTKVRVVRKSLIGQAYLVELRDFTLSMRKNIASYILIKEA